MNLKKKVGRPKRGLNAYSAQQFSRIKERSEKMVFNDERLKVRVEDYFIPQPNQNRLLQIDEDIDYNLVEMEEVNDNINDWNEECEDNNNYLNNDEVGDHDNNECNNDDFYLSNNDEGYEQENEIMAIQSLLENNLKFQNKLSFLNKMKFDDLCTLIDDSICNNERNEMKATDANESLVEANTVIPDSNITIGSFAKSIIEFISTTNLGADNIIKLLLLLKDHFPFAKIPLKITSFGNYKSTLSDYEQKNIAIIEVDVCINSCIVFSGEYLNDWYCKNCNAKRYTNCKYCSSKINNYNYECSCCTRIPFKKLIYRSIKSIICNLMRYELFRYLINYTYYDMTKYINSNLKHWDILKILKHI